MLLSPDSCKSDSWCFWYTALEATGEVWQPLDVTVSLWWAGDCWLAVQRAYLEDNSTNSPGSHFLKCLRT